MLGGAIIALAIERTRLHRRLALAIVKRGGSTPAAMLLAFMMATALISMIVSNTATTLIMMPIALAVLAARQGQAGPHRRLRRARWRWASPSPRRSAGLGTLVGSPTNAIAAGIIERATGLHIGFLTWAMYGMPLVLVAIPLTWWILMKVQRVAADRLRPGRRRSPGSARRAPGAIAEKRLVPLIAAVVAGWVAIPFLIPLLPKDSLTDGTIAVAGALAAVRHPRRHRPARSSTGRKPTARRGA